MISKNTDRKLMETKINKKIKRVGVKMKDNIYY